MGDPKTGDAPRAPGAVAGGVWPASIGEGGPRAKARLAEGARSLARLIALASLTLMGLRGAVPARAQAAGPEYLVQPGDSLYTIAARFDATVEALQSLNGIADAATIYIGQVLVLPGFQGVTGRLTTHPVEFGDDLAGLAHRLGAPTETLIRLNRLTNPSALFLGQPVIHPEATAEASRLESTQTHLASPGETLWGLAARHAVHPLAIALANESVFGLTLVPGQPVRVPSPGLPPARLPAPLASFALSTLPARQGRTLVLKATLDGEAALSGTLDERPLRFAEEGGAWYALQGIEAEAEPGTHPLTVRVDRPSGQSFSVRQLLPVRGVDYGTQLLPPVDPVTVGTALNDREWDYLLSFTTRFSPVRYWQGSFLRPHDGPVTSPFGIRRTYNDGQLVSSHTGTDFGGLPGSPIYATAPGVVVMAEPLTVRGNATLIDHGWGVYSGYWHQSEIEVRVGDAVRAGQEIGRLGSTGRATGPNLHWEVWVGGVPVDPMEWVETAFP